MNKGSLGFFHQIEKLRLAAAVLYDKGRALGAKPEDIQKDIAPITERLKRAGRAAVKEDFAGVVLAIKGLESQADAFEHDAKFLISKGLDNRNHAAQLRAEIMNDLQTRGVRERTEAGFSVTWTEQTLPGGKKIPELTFR